MGLSRTEEIVESILNGTSYNDSAPMSRLEELFIELKQAIETGGGGSGSGMTPAQINSLKQSIISDITPLIPAEVDPEDIITEVLARLPENTNGAAGYSPTIVEKTNTDDTYILTVTYKDGSGTIQSYDTPNLKGGSGGSSVSTAMNMSSNSASTVTIPVTSGVNNGEVTE